MLRLAEDRRSDRRSSKVLATRSRTVRGTQSATHENTPGDFRNGDLRKVKAPLSYRVARSRIDMTVSRSRASRAWLAVPRAGSPRLRRSEIVLSTVSKRANPRRSTDTLAIRVTLTSHVGRNERPPREYRSAKRLEFALEVPRSRTQHLRAFVNVRVILRARSSGPLTIGGVARIGHGITEIA